MTEIPPAPRPPFRTARLILRDYREDDLAAIHDYASDPEVARYMDWGPNTPEESRAHLERVLAAQGDAPDVLNVGLEVAAEGRLIGALRFEVKDPGNRTADVGWTIHRAYWGRGLVTEAGREILRIAFGDMALHRVWATCDARNIGSWRVMEKLGMRREGVLRKANLRKDGWRDTLLYAVLAEEWAAS
ncbi:MAG: GNAT family protein [Phenylobacterium sp.]